MKLDIIFTASSNIQDILSNLTKIESYFGKRMVEISEEFYAAEIMNVDSNEYHTFIQWLRENISCPCIILVLDDTDEIQTDSLTSGVSVIGIK